MTDPEIHHSITFTPADGISACPRCHREKLIGVCNDGCKMCQSCYHFIHSMIPLPSDSMEKWK